MLIQSRIGLGASWFSICNFKRQHASQYSILFDCTLRLMVLYEEVHEGHLHLSVASSLISLEVPCFVCYHDIAWFACAHRAVCQLDRRYQLQKSLLLTCSQVKRQ